MSVDFGRARLLGSGVLGIVLAFPAALLLSTLTARKDGFVFFFFPRAIVFTVFCERVWGRARKQDAELMRERYAKGLPIGKP